MTIYILYLGFIFFWAFWCNVSKSSLKKGNQENRFLNVVWIAMFLLCVLRASSVGRDVPGYELAYQMTADVPFSDFDYIYFENGYVLLMKLCLAMNFSFQGFLVIVYTIILLPIYFYIRDFSKDKFLSVIIYVCYMYFEFNLTGIRQAMATSVVLIGYMLYIKASRFNRFWLLLFVTLAIFFHKAAFICYSFIIASCIKSIYLYTVAIFGVTVVIFFTRSLFIQYIKDLFEKETMNENAGLYIGMNFVFTLALCVAFVYCYVMKNKRFSKVYNTVGSTERELFDFQQKNDEVNIKIFLLSVTTLILFGSDTAVRSYMLLAQTMIVQLPNSLDAFDKDSKRIIRLVLIGFFVVFLFTNSLLPNGFEIVPYKFFWQ